MVRYIQTGISKLYIISNKIVEEADLSIQGNSGTRNQTQMPDCISAPTRHLFHIIVNMLKFNHSQHVEI